MSLPRPLAIWVLAGIVLVAIFWTTSALGAQDGGKGKDKDKTPPVITGVVVDSITENSAVILWETDEPADSSIRYGIDPKTNIKGPEDATLVLSHAIALSELTLATTYAFCVESKDEAKNKSESCGTFITLAEPPPPPPPAEGGGGGVGGMTIKKPQASISGFAYPGATVRAVIQPIPFGKAVEQKVTAENDGSFSLDFEHLPFGLHTFLLSAEDKNGVQSVRKGIQFDYSQGDARIFKEKVIIPPTISLEREVIAWGDDIAISGSATPETGVLIEAGGLLHETKSDKEGAYRIQINSARFAPGKEGLRARSTMISDFGYDYSLSKVVTLSGTSVPQADLNADSVVDIRDFSMFLANPVDTNNDGKVNSADVSIFLRAFKIHLP